MNQHILADKGYDSDELECSLITACIPSRANRKNLSSDNKGHYRHRHNIENFFQRIKEDRVISLRYERLAERFLGFVTLVAILLWV